MSFADHRTLGARFAKAMNERDASQLASIVTPDFVNEWPQSRERIRGLDNFLSTLINYPGAAEGLVGNDEATVRSHPVDGLKIIAPTYTLVRVEGAGDAGTFTLRVRYPDGSHWWAVNIYHLRDGRIDRAISYFAPEYPAPEWRRQWVEIMPEPDAT